MKKHHLFVAIFILCNNAIASAQSTWSSVYTTLQANCIGCHSGGSPSGTLNLSGSSTDVFNALVNQAPTNPTALEKGNMLVDPGYPEKSFLLRKCATNSWDNWSEYSLSPTEGASMPESPSPLSDAEIEMMRQWILFGASETDTVVDASLISDFYNGMGLPRLTPPTAPPVGEGFQIRLGSFFLGPGEEIEFFKKQKIDITSNKEVIKLEPIFNEESHHFILYRFDELTASNYQEGMRNSEDGEGSMFDSDIVAAWQNPEPIELPATTAYSWQVGDVLDMNYHLVNYNQDSILAADVYLNIYTQDEGIAEHEMKSRGVPIDWLTSIMNPGIGPGPSLIIPNDGQTYTFEESIFAPPLGDWHIWRLGTHTHSRGTDFDVYLRYADGSRGDQIYEGFFNTDYTFNQGYYDNEHPPTRYFESPLLQVDMTYGLTFEAKYLNAGSDTLTWGPTTQDEMMLIFLQYTEEALSTNAVNDYNAIDKDLLQVWPNPFSDQITISFEVENMAGVRISLLDLMGREVQNVAKVHRAIGTYEYVLDSSDLESGIYFVQLEINGKRISRKIVKNS